MSAIPSPLAAPLPARSVSTPVATGDERLLRGLVLAGIVGIAAVWAIESTQGLISAWDRVLYPVALLWLALSAAALVWRPRWEPTVRLSAVLCLNLIVLIEMGMILATAWPGIDLYQLIATLYWTPLGFGCAFVFLPMRQALCVSALVYAGEFGPVTWLLAMHDVKAQWPAFVPSLMANVAVAQPLFVLMMIGISRLRLNAQRAQERAEVMQLAAATDALTGLGNRRAIDAALAAFTDGVRLGRPGGTLFLIDVDHFKGVNDRHGHAAGDAVLVELARLLASQVRTGDQLGRWGGEEFVALMHGTTLPVALELAERLRTAIEAHAFGPGLRVTVSIGVAPCLAGDRPEALLERADHALYAAKSAGRNRVCTAPG